ncbi:MAG: PadR family transcriptional regulator [Chloroflexi bacterium]|nr:PadR family transcriptional regulator [Chloroflexota bacterium]
MRRKKDVLISLEISILAAFLSRGPGKEEIHGFLIAKLIKDQVDARMLTAHGTLYRALSRLEKAGLLKSRWEDPVDQVDEVRPRRRLYRITAEGMAAFDAATASEPEILSDPRLATT